MKKDYTQKEVASEMGIPAAHVKHAKELGFEVKYNRWDLEAFKTWYELNKELVAAFVDEKESDAGSGDADERIKEQKFRILKVNADAAEGKSLDKEKVLAIARGVLDAQSIILQTRKQELALKLVGKDAKTIANEIGISDEKFLSILKTQIEKWIVEKKTG